MATGEKASNASCESETGLLACVAAVAGWIVGEGIWNNDDDKEEDEVKLLCEGVVTGSTGLAEDVLERLEKEESKAEHPKPVVICDIEVISGHDVFDANAGIMATPKPKTRIFIVWVLFPLDNNPTWAASECRKRT
jgi:hypothetical protein